MKYSQLRDPDCASTVSSLPADGGLQPADRTSVTVDGDLGVSSNFNSSTSALSGRVFGIVARKKWKPSLGQSPHGKQLADSKQAALIHGLARALLSYGAPGYRVEHRVHDAAEVIGIPTSICCLPSTILITTGDGSTIHPTRTFFVDVVTGFHMGKLNKVDRLARRCLELTKQPIESGSSSLQGSMAQLSNQSSTQIPAASDVSIDMDSIDHKSTSDDRYEEDLISNPRASERKHIGLLTRPIHFVSRTFARSPLFIKTTLPLSSPSPSKMAMPPPEAESVAETPDSVDKILSDLDDIVTESQDHPILMRVLPTVCQATSITLLLFYGTAADAVMSGLFAAFTSFTSYFSDLMASQGASEFIIAAVISFLSRLLERLWPGNRELIFGEKGFGGYLCYSVISLSGITPLLPGFQITLGMLDLSQSPVSGSVRIVQAVIRALKLGFGLSMGSTLAIYAMTQAGMQFPDWGVDPSSSAHCPDRKNSLEEIEYWRLIFFVPMNMANLLLLKAERGQWLRMSLSSLLAFVTSTIARAALKPDIATMIASLVLGLAANTSARLSNDIAISSVLSGICWLVPGTVGVTSAVSLYQTYSSSFGYDMITRAMAIAIGLYVANICVFPIRKKREADDAMAA